MAIMNKIKVLIAEDSKVISKMLISLFDSADDIEVVGSVHNGVDAVEMTKKLKPDIVTMDIHMPQIDGLEATKKIMSECPTPIVIISSYVDDDEMNITFDALNEGALAVLAKPKYFSDDGFISEGISLLDTIRALSEVKVITRRKIKTVVSIPKVTSKIKTIKVCAIGASTGGPNALNLIFSSLPKKINFPIVVVQHIASGFLPGLVSWLNLNSKLPISIINDAMHLEPNHIYFAGEGKHLVLYSDKNSVIARQLNSDPVSYFRPSVTVLFDSIARNFEHGAMGCLLTGMGLMELME
ncbi:MAG: response regulator [Francisellaceae bacterium]|jgi:two-component system, chemotaxis family, protein-glutamate methylesterase/glutaminase|nr:response regulator [Francisellaceae bacterium]